MAPIRLMVSIALVVVAALWACSSAQPSCSPPAIISLQPCLGFITGNSSSMPSPQCCGQLASMVQSQAQCLCTFLNSAPPLPFNINRTQAITLPGACKIQTMPLSQCNAQAGPVVPGIPTGPVVPGTPSGPAAGSPQGAPPAASPVTPSAAAAPAPTTPATPSASGGVSPPSIPTPSTKGVPPANDGSKQVPGNGKSSTSAASSTVFAPSIFILAASVFFSF